LRQCGGGGAGVVAHHEERLPGFQFAANSADSTSAPARAVWSQTGRRKESVAGSRLCGKRTVGDCHSMLPRCVILFFFRDPSNFAPGTGWVPGSGGAGRCATDWANEIGASMTGGNTRGDADRSANRPLRNYLRLDEGPGDRRLMVSASVGAHAMWGKPL